MILYSTNLSMTEELVVISVVVTHKLHLAAAADIGSL